MAAGGDMIDVDERLARVEEFLRAEYADEGLVSDLALSVEIIEPDGTTTLHHLTSSNATGWKAHGMALYLAAAHAPDTRADA